MRLGTDRRRAYRRGGAPAGVVVGLLGVAAAGYMSLHSAADARAYAASPSCRAGFAAVRELDDLCWLAAARIVSAHYTGKGRTETLKLHFRSGGIGSTNVGRDVYGRLWQAARAGVALDATVQFEGDAIVQVETAAGRIETENYPQVALQKWTVLGVVAGAIATICALIVAVRGLS